MVFVRRKGARSTSYSAPYLTSRPGIADDRCSPGAPGIDAVTYDYFTSPKHDDTVIVTCQARVWDSAPGAVAEVKGYGAVDGRWITNDILRASLRSATTTVTLGRPQKKLDEPAPQQITNPAQVDVTRVTGGSIRDRVVAVAEKAYSLEQGDPSYYYYSQIGVWKFNVLERDAPNERSDCSST